MKCSEGSAPSPGPASERDAMTAARCSDLDGDGCFSEARDGNAATSSRTSAHRALLTREMWVNAILGAS